MKKIKGKLKMGGTISVVYRENEKNTYNMLRWTNVLPSFCHDFNLFKGNTKEFSKEFLHSWLGMKNDYAENKHTKSFKFPMTDMYFPWNKAAPSGYGLLVIDAVNKQILHSQGYASFGDVQSYQVENQLSRHNIDEFITAYEKYKKDKIHHTVAENNDSPFREVDNFETLFDNGFINALTFKHLDAKQNVLTISIPFKDIGITDFHTFLKFFYNSAKDDQFNIQYNGQEIAVNKFCSYMEIDPIKTGWTTTRFEEDLDGTLKLREAMKNLGFVFTKSDNKEWISYIKDRFLYEENNVELEQKIQGLEEQWASETTIKKIKKTI